MAESPGSALVAVISKELDSVRKRGIERLDVSSHNQQPVQVPELDKLAASYARAKHSLIRDRIPRLKYLLRDAVKAFGAEGGTDAQLVAALFFGDSLDRVTKTAGELLDIAQRKSGYDNAVRFRQARHAVFDRFAEFLPRFVVSIPSVTHTGDDGADEPIPETNAAVTLPGSHADVAPAPEVQQHIASTGYIDDGDHFVALLSQAENVTVVGYTNESLASMLQLALYRKRAAMFRPDSCWSSVRVVFLTDDLLDRVNDERVYPNPVEARALRRRHAVYGRRTVRIFLRSLPDRTSWAIYDSPHFPPFTGTIFEMSDGQRIVQLIVRRPQRRGPNHLYLQLEDTRGHYFSSVFDEIVDSATDDNKLVPAGRPVGKDRFRVLSTRFRRQVLVDGRNVGGWLPMVLVITWQMRAGRAEPLLQLRTQRNSTRELDRFTHLAGHITQEQEQEQEQPIAEQEFGPDDSLPMLVAAQRVQMETGQNGPVELTLVNAGAPEVAGRTGRYYHYDKEHLFFFVYACRLPDELQVWPKAEMFALTIPELLAIRENQVLRNALTMCEAAPLRRPARGAAFEIMAQNLILHGYPDIAGMMTEASGASNADFRPVAAKLGPLEERTRTAWPAHEGETEVVGLSGFQFREFFRTLLPFYESVGVPGAARELALIRDDDAKRAAAERLSELYTDERVMESIPIEL
jgi:hypothetical protein